MTATASVIQRRPWSTLLGCLLFGAVVSVCLGQDANWDLLNYHLYNAWALVHGRLHLDIAAAGMQSWFNPLLDLPFHAMAMGPLGHWPRLIAALQGLYYGGFIYLVWCLVARIARLQSRPFDAGDGAAVVIGVTGSAAVAQIGATFNEMPLAMLLVGSAVLVFKAFGDDAGVRGRRGAWRVGAAGLLAGLAAGLKPTAIVYVPALALGLLCAVHRRRWRWSALLLVGAGLGFLASYGWWGWTLYRLTGNPVFPLFNNVFHSQWVSWSNGTDDRFRPEGLMQWLFYPFYWASDVGRWVTRPGMRDVRLALAAVAGLSMPLLWAGQRWWRLRTRPPGPPGQQATERFVAAFLVVGYVAWLALFSIYRYAIPLEALAGIAIVMGLGHWVDAPRDATRRGARLFKYVAITVAVLVVASTRYPHWHHVDFGAREFAVEVPAVDDGSLVLLVGQPVAYVAPFVDADRVRFIGINWFVAAARGHGLWTQVQNQVASHAGPIVAIVRDQSRPAMSALEHLGLAIDPDRCKPIASNLERTPRGPGPSPVLRLCQVDRHAQ